MSSQDSVPEKYYELLRLQRRVNKVLDVQVQDGAAELAAANEGLKREIDKLVRLDADTAIFRAIERAAWEAPDSGSFARLARETEAKVRLKLLTAEHGAPPAFRKSIRDSEQAIEQKEQRLKTLEESVAKLGEQLAPVFEHNNNYSGLRIAAENREKIEAAGFFAKLNDEKLAATCNVVSTYAGQYAYWEGQNQYKANCFDDMARLAAEKKEIEGLRPEIEFLMDKHYQRLGAYREVRDVQRILQECGAEEKKPVDLAAFQQELCMRLQDGNFLNCFARETASGVGGGVILAALGVTLRRQVNDRLTAYQKQVREATTLLEGPIGTIARATRVERAIEGIERDIRAQALMTGYLCISAADTLKALSSFRPEQAEGPASLKRDIQIHLAANGGVDPAFIHEVFGMDRTLAGIFNVNAARPVPRFREILANPVAAERIDRHYAAFLRENAGDEEVHGAGFAAGQFDIISFERFLGRYFPAGTTYDQLAAALASEAESIEAVDDRRESMGISRGGPRLPDLGR